MFFFFFSSRRRHTRCYRDWSSDVCSSDLGTARTSWPGRCGTCCGCTSRVRSSRGSTACTRSPRRRRHTGASRAGRTSARCCSCPDRCAAGWMSTGTGGHHDRVEFEEVARELYGLPPEEFVAARDQRAAQARSEGDRESSRRIRELRRPTLAAWAVNQLVRDQPQTADQILSLGSELRQAWTAANGPQLQELS